MMKLPIKASGWLPVMALLIAITSIQGGASLAKSLFPVVGASGVTSLRLALASLILLVIFRPWRLHFSRKQLIPLIIYGLALGSMNFLFYLSLRTVPQGIAVALEFTGPLAVALFSSRRIIDFIWVTLVILGLGFLLPIQGHQENMHLIDVACALGAGVCWALYILFGQRAGSQHGSATVALGTLIAAIIFVPAGLIQAGESIWHWSVLPIGLGVAILSTAIPYSLEMLALTRLPAQTIGTLFSLEPAVGALSGLLFLGETLTFTQFLALLCIIVASVGSTMTIQHKNRHLDND